MRLWIRLLSAAVGVAVLCGGCAEKQNPPQSAPILPMTTSMRSLQFIVNSDLGPEILAQADAFADGVARASDGRLTIEVTTGKPNFDTLKSGQTDLLLLRNEDLAQLDDRVKTLSEPFLFDDPRHVSLSLNSEEMMKELDERVAPQGVRLLNAFYGGSRFWMTQKGLILLPEDLKDLPVAMRADIPERIAAYRALGIRVLTRMGSELPQLLGAEVEETQTGEKKPETLKVETVELDWDQPALLENDPNTLYLLKTYHVVEPYWLAGNATTLGNLSEFERAALSEGCAGMLSEFERMYTSRESEMFTQQRKLGVEVVEIERQQFASALYDKPATTAVTPAPDVTKYEQPAWFDRTLYDIVQSYSTL